MASAGVYNGGQEPARARLIMTSPTPFKIFVH